jgi:pyruvate/2-oxoglutarate dehydrogenase complex dihydrolipoamide dehydrogenase (E3) component
MIEKVRLGGECTNSGCVPSKALIRTSRMAREIRSAGRYGLEIRAGVEMGTERVMAHVRSVVQKVYGGHGPEVFQRLGIAVLFGAPVFTDNHRIELNGRSISAKQFVIATGSSPAVPSIEGIETIPYLTNQNIFESKKADIFQSLWQRCCANELVWFWIGMHDEYQRMIKEQG